jgi:hypothetical protein
MAITQNASADIQSHQLLSALNVLKPQEMAKLFRMNQAGMEGNAYLYTHALGFQEKVAGEDYFHTEKDLSNASLQVDAVVGATSNTYTLQNDSATYQYVRVGDVLLFSDAAKTSAIVTAVDRVAGTFTCTGQGGATLPTTTLDDYVIIKTSAKGSASNVGDPRFTRASKFQSRLQIIKEKVSADGTSLTDETWVPFGTQGYFSMNLSDGELNLLRKIEGMFVHGVDDNTIVDPDSVTGATFNTSKGLIDTAINNGTTIAPPTTMSSFDTTSLSMIANFVSTTTPLYSKVGHNMLLDIENAFIGSSSVLIDSREYLAKATDDKLFIAGQTYGAYVNFKYLNKRFTYQFESDDSWSDPTSYGATGYDYNSTGVVVPIYKSKDGMTGKKLGTIGMRYKDHNGLNRKMMMDSLDGFGTTNGRSINEIDTKSYVWLCHMGNEFMGGHQFVRWES